MLRRTTHSYRFAGRTVLFVLALFASSALQAQLPFELELTAASVEYGEFQLEDVKLEGVNPDGLRLTVAQVRMAGQPELEVRDIALQCGQLQGELQGWCVDGDWQLQVQSPGEGWQQLLQGQLTEAVWTDQQQSIRSSLEAGKFRAQLGYSAGTGQPAPTLGLDWKPQALDRLPFRSLLPSQLDWIKTGTIQGQAELVLAAPEPADTAAARKAGEGIAFKVALADVSLDSPDGLFAAEGLRLRSSGRFLPGSESSLELNTQFLAGQLLLDQFYTEFGPHAVRLDTRLVVVGDQVEVRSVQLDDGSALRLQASAGFALGNPGESLQYQVKQLDMQFPLAYERYLAPVLASLTLDKLTVTGGLSWAGSGVAGAFPDGTLRLEDLSVVDHEQDRFAFTGMNANIQAGQSAGQSQFSWRGLLLGRINLGAGGIALHTAPGHFELAEPLQLDMLGGEFSVDEFSLDLPPAGATDADPVVKFNAGLHELDMEQLTAALGWPTFSGQVSGRIPGASFDQGVLAVDGVLEFQAFDGRIELSDLRVERIFGVLPSFAANLKVDNLDLELLTSAYSFGSIAGRLDGYVNELRMLDWSPVSFDAWFGTPARQSDSRSISRQAVNNLTSIGGGGATAALTGPVMRLFSNFSYKRLGMGCRLENYVCTIRGLADEDNSVLIMEGSGIPKLSIRVFNRRMDFPQLVANLVAATSGGDIRIGDP